MDDKALRRLVTESIQEFLKEDYARGIPDFALRSVASETCENLKRHMRRHIQSVAKDPVHQRKMLAAAESSLEDLEEKMLILFEEKLLQFMRST
jgi:hypothetical protein